MTTKEHLSKHDREIAEMWELMGKLAKGALAAQDELSEIREDRRKAWAAIRETQVAIRETQAAIRELSAAQKRTEASLRAFIDSLRQAGNGHTKRKIDP